MVNLVPSDRRARWGVTDAIKVKSHLEDVWAHQSSCKARSASTACVQTPVADVVAEEAAKRLLPDLNLDREAKKAERIGIGVAKRLALVQADIWAKRGAAGDIYELEPLLTVEETRTRSATGKLVDELAQQGLLLVCHNKGLKCKGCNVYRADRQFSFWNRTPFVPRPCAAEIISQSRKEEKTAQRVRRRFGLRQVCSSYCRLLCNQRANTSTRDVESGQGAAYLISKCEVGLVTLLAQVGGYSHRDRFSLLVSPEIESDVAHTQQFFVCASPSQFGEQCDGSRCVSAQSHFRGMDGKSRKLESAKGVVCTPIFAAEKRVVSLETQTKVDSDDPNGPRAPLRSNLDDPEEWERSCSDGESGCWDEAHRMDPVTCRPIIKCGTTGCTGSCPTSVV